MTGGGVLTLHDGLARYVNPNTVRQIVRASDLGQQFSEDALRAAFGERIDADNLAFKQCQRRLRHRRRGGAPEEPDGQDRRAHRHAAMPSSISTR